MPALRSYSGLFWLSGIIFGLTLGAGCRQPVDGLGESIPQEAEMRGYPHFINRNRAGDYRFRMRAAYHHIDAGHPDDAQVVIAPGAVRDSLFGLVPTSDTKERKQIAQARKLRAVQPDEVPETEEPRKAVEAVTIPEAETGEETSPTGEDD